MRQIYFKKAQGTNKLAYHAYSHYLKKKEDFLAVTNFRCNNSRLLPNQETEEMRLKTN